MKSNFGLVKLLVTVYDGYVVILYMIMVLFFNGHEVYLSNIVLFSNGK
jgi:hypothetical protein